MAKNDDDSQDAKQLTPEQRIAKLEKNRLFSWIACGLLLVLVLVEAGGLFLLATQGPDPRVSDHEQRFGVVMNEIELLESAYETAQAYNDNADQLEKKLKRITTTVQLNNFSALRTLMIEQEQSYQQFLRALQQGMYDVSRMVKGSRTWFEVYKEDLDLVISDSKSRTELLKKGLVAPLNRKTVKPPEATAQIE
ncbi:MAG: hypothetical protein V7707_20370 [Motiliproteus sp.]